MVLEKSPGLCHIGQSPKFFNLEDMIEGRADVPEEAGQLEETAALNERHSSDWIMAQTALLTNEQRKNLYVQAQELSEFVASPMPEQIKPTWQQWVSRLYAVSLTYWNRCIRHISQSRIAIVLEPIDAMPKRADEELSI